MKVTLSKICNRETIAFLICGILTTLINIGIFLVCERMGWGVAAGNTAATAAAMTFAYFANKIFVFQSTSWAVKVLAKEVPAFLSWRFASYVAETALLVLLVDAAGLPAAICKIFTVAVATVINYVTGKKAVFKIK